MDIQSLLNLAAGVVLTVLGWFARQIWDAVKALEKDIHEIEVALPTKYVSKTDYAATMIEIKEMLRRIDEKLDAKADKGSISARLTDQG